MNHLIRIILAVGLSITAVLIILFSTEQFGPHAQMDAFIAEQAAPGSWAKTWRLNSTWRRVCLSAFSAKWSRRRSRRTAPSIRVTLPSALGQPISTTRMAMTYPLPELRRRHQTAAFSA